MLRATTWRKDAAGVQFGCDSANAADALGPQVFHDSAQVGRTLRRVRLDAATACLLPTCFARRARAPFWLPNFTPRALAATRAALVRALIMRDAAQRGRRREAIRLEGTGGL
jgi:hypothetical protein